MVHTIVWRVGSEDSLDFWEQRLEGEAANVTRSGESLSFEDPEGVGLELAVDETGDDPLVGAPSGDRRGACDPRLRRRARVHRPRS